MNKFANLKNKNEWNPLVEGGVGGGGSEGGGGAANILTKLNQIEF